MSKKIFVGNLPFGLEEDKLKELFTSYGEISEALLIRNKFGKFKGKSKGMGFITFVDDSVADRAIAEMNNKEIEGRSIKVDEAKPLREQPEEDEKAGKKVEEPKPEAEEKPEEKVEENTEEPKAE